MKGKVLTLTDFGIFVELDGGVEGLVYSSEIVKPATGRIEDVLNPGDDINIRIIKVDCEERKIGLSMRNLKRSGE